MINEFPGDREASGLNRSIRIMRERRAKELIGGHKCERCGNVFDIRNLNRILSVTHRAGNTRTRQINYRYFCAVCFQKRREYAKKV